MRDPNGRRLYALSHVNWQSVDTFRKSNKFFVVMSPPSGSTPTPASISEQLGGVPVLTSDDHDVSARSILRAST